MKYLIITQEYPPSTGGAGVVAQQNAEALAALGHEITVLTRAWGNASVKKNIKFLAVSGFCKLWPFYISKELRQLNIDEFDLIILNDIGATFVFSSFFCGEKYYEKTIVYLHGGEVQTVLQNPKGYLKWTRFLLRYIRLVQSCKRVVAVSHYMKKYFEDHFPEPIDDAQIAVIYAGVDKKIFHPVETSVRRDLGIDQDRPLLITVARIIKEKGFPKMLRIFEKAWKENPALCWIIAGDGPYLAELKRNAAISEAGSSIHLVGRVDRDNLPVYYSAADLFWLMSERDSESFGLVYVEAQLCGCPAMGPDKFGVKETISHGQSGFLVTSDAECLIILNKRDFMRIDRISVETFATKFCLDKQISKLEVIGHE